MNKIELENRLIDFSILIIELVRNLPDEKSMNHLANQLIRSGTSPALNYGEAQSGESRKDFIHKLKIILKELRESHICLRIINKSNLSITDLNLETVINECNELISIFAKSVDTAVKNFKSELA